MSLGAGSDIEYLSADEDVYKRQLYPGYSDDELYDIMVKSNAENLYDERVNLNIQLSQPIIAVSYTHLDVYKRQDILWSKSPHRRVWLSIRKHTRSS